MTDILSFIDALHGEEEPPAEADSIRDPFDEHSPSAEPPSGDDEEMPFDPFAPQPIPSSRKPKTNDKRKPSPKPIPPAEPLIERPTNTLASESGSQVDSAPQRYASLV